MIVVYTCMKSAFGFEQVLNLCYTLHGFLIYIVVFDLRRYASLKSFTSSQ